MTRNQVAFLATFIVALGCLTVAVGTRHLKVYMLRGYVDPVQTKSLPYRELNRIGVNADLMLYAPGDELNQQLTWMQEANIHWIRQFIYWDEIEPVQGSYRWQKMDEIVQAVDQYPDLQIIPVLMNSPSWAHTADYATTPPDNPSSFARFAASFAERYGSSIDYYQVWDEPNLDDAWGQRNPQPAEYTALLAEAYRAIHSSDQQATVIAAALAPTVERSGSNISDIDYLQDLYALNADIYFDATAAKPYGFDHPPDDRTVDINSLNYSRIIALREIMTQNGDGTKALWASNFGWNALPAGWSGTESIWGQVSELTQSRYTKAAIQRAEREWAWLGGLILHHWQPDAPPTDPIWGFSVIDQSGTRTDLWHMLNELSLSTLPSNGLYHPRTKAAAYSGLWTFSALGADIGWLETSDSHFSFDFVGRDVALLLREGDYFAFLYPKIDGKQPNSIPQDANGNGYIFLRSGTLEPELTLVPVATELEQRVHTLEAVADRGWDQWALAGYAVSDGDLSLPYDRQITLAWFGFAMAVIAGIIVGWQINWVRLIHPTEMAWNRLNDISQTIISICTSLALLLGMILTWNDVYPSIFRREAFQLVVGVIVSGGLIAFQPGYILVIFSSIILFWMIYHRLDLGVQLIILYAPFFLFPVELYNFAFPMAELLLLITVAATLLRFFVQWGRRRQTEVFPFVQSFHLHISTVDWILISWIGIATLSLSWATYIEPALTEWRTLFLEPFLFYCIIRFIHPTKDQLLRWLDTLLIAGTIVCIIGIVLYSQGEAIITAEGGVKRLASVYGSPNNVGLLLERCMPFALAYALSAALSSQRRYISILIVALYSITILLTQSVGTLLFGVPATIIVVLLAHLQRQATRYVVFFVSISIICLVVAVNTSPRFAGLLDLSSGTNFMRLRVWESTLEIIQDFPLSGLGLDQFLPFFRGYYIRPDAIFDPDLSHPHNIILDFWVRLGVLGLGVLAAIIMIFWKRMYEAYQTIKQPEHRAVVIGGMGSMASLLAHGLIDNSIYVSDLAYVFILLMTLAHYLPLNEENSR